MTTQFHFRLLRTSKTDFYLFGSLPDHITPMLAINKHAGGEVVKLNGTGFGVNLKIIDFDLWSDKISQFVEGEHPDYVLNLP